MSIPYLTALAGAVIATSVPYAADSAPAALPVFVDHTEGSGVDFVHHTGADGRFWFPEITGAGVALFDVDGDDDLDLFLIDGGALAPGAVGRDRPAHALYLNRGDGTFVDGTAESGIVGRGYGQGCAVGDFDGDGDADLYLTNLGPNQLFRNDGAGRFRDVTAVAGVAGRGGWSKNP